MSYTRIHDFVNGGEVQSGQVDAEFNAIEDAFADFAAAAKINDGRSVYGDDSGSANTVVVSNDGSTTLQDGQIVVFKPAATNTGATTLDLNSAGAQAVVRQDGNALQAGDLLAGIPYTAVYDIDNTRWVLQGAPMNAILSALRPSIITDATTSRTLALTDETAIILFTNASAITVTVPPESSVACPNGFICHVYQGGAGQITIAPGSGVTLKRPLSLKTRTQESSLTLIKVGTNEWQVIGDAEA